MVCLQYSKTFLAFGTRAGQNVAMPLWILFPSKIFLQLIKICHVFVRVSTVLLHVSRTVISVLRDCGHRSKKKWWNLTGAAASSWWSLARKPGAELIQVVGKIRRSLPPRKIETQQPFVRNLSEHLVSTGWSRLQNLCFVIFSVASFERSVGFKNMPLFETCLLCWMYPYHNRPASCCEGPNYQSLARRKLPFALRLFPGQESRNFASDHDAALMLGVESVPYHFQAKTLGLKPRVTDSFFLVQFECSKIGVPHLAVDTYKIQHVLFCFQLWRNRVCSWSRRVVFCRRPKERETQNCDLVCREIDALATIMGMYLFYWTAGMQD